MGVRKDHAESIVAEMLDTVKISGVHPRKKFELAQA